MRIGKWAVLLAVFWLLLSGYIQPLLLSFGAASVAIVLFVLHRMDAIDEEPEDVGNGPQIVRYIVWLLGQIMQSSTHVTKLVWGSSSQVSPCLAKISAQDVPPENRVLYANSITLTPGTLSVDLEDDEITVHALQKASIEELEQGGMERKITGIWGKNT
ncbi:Na+/H+ antiporter subunit E [Porticoccus sp. W117]|uniref:Na+/H+ antiporter subunit E n=1 Tax=Porticoccus sp. W117 TaxID=3054777 RepID=UPI00259A4989|nr:Na+/H+ antiporter subunit E [Porticoccus sp. W117]MDM3871523.1 Na+/H+ antiporter subunit E [Porticoccus sp. W117]